MVCIYIPDFTGSCGADSTFGPWASQDTFGTPVPLNVGRYRLDPGARARWLARGRCTGSGTTRMRTSPSSSSGRRRPPVRSGRWPETAAPGPRPHRAPERLLSSRGPRQRSRQWSGRQENVPFGVADGAVIGPFSGHLRILPSKRPATAVRVKEVRRQPS